MKGLNDNERALLYNFLMWFSENGELFMTTNPGISIEQIINIYLLTKNDE